LLAVRSVLSDEIGRHDPGGALAEGERGSQHSPVAHRREFRQPLGVRRLQLLNGIGAVSGLLSNAV